MAWFDKHKWSRQQVEREREALATSVEELTARAKITDCEEDEEANVASTGKAVVIPPKLSLQSRALPIARVEETEPMPAKRELEQEIRMPHPDESVILPGKRLGRSTKVRLQAVLPGPVLDPITERVPVVETSEPRESTRDGLSTRDGQAIARRIETLAATSSVSPPALLCGSGVIEKDQEDATIHNARISARSVVTVMLAGNPGPVVVHYISLQPRAGFTLHMSAPVVAATSFHYAVWLF